MFDEGYWCWGTEVIEKGVLGQHDTELRISSRSLGSMTIHFHQDIMLVQGQNSALPKTADNVGFHRIFYFFK